MKELMIDLETLGTRPGSVVHEVAAVAFDLETGETGAEFYAQISICSALAHGLTTDRDTLEFWNDRGGPRQEQAEGLKAAVTLLGLFVAEVDPIRVWAWGTDFDLPMIRGTFEACGEEFPSHYAAARDARTVWKLAFPTEQRARQGGHHAGADCHDQITALVKALQSLKS